MRYDFLKVSTCAGNISDTDIDNVRVDREDELNSIVHLTTKANENVYLLGTEGKASLFLVVGDRTNHIHAIPFRLVETQTDKKKLTIQKGYKTVYEIHLLRNLEF